MNFFQAQQKAKSSTFRLLLMFALAVLCLILITDIFIFIAYALLSSDMHTNTALFASVNATSFILLSTLIASVIVIGSTCKSIALSAGGPRVLVESMSARRVLSASEDLREQRLLNIVEEMAIASGVPVPLVYILDDEAAINAFAAGFSTKDAVIVVTRGTLESLSRDELQGVIAHEYSHILNGDMALNIQLVGILYGILVLGLIGNFLLRSSSRSRMRESGGIALFGLGLIIIGYGGTFFGNLIKSAISRQREYLADASAVQFTRQVEGLAGALKKIGGMGNHARLQNKNAEVMSHAYFAQGVSNYLGALTATHPALDKRIRRIQPDWDGRYLNAAASAVEAHAQAKKPAARQQRRATTVASSTLVLHSIIESLNNATQAGEKEINTARAIIDDIPESLREAAYQPHSARALLYCLLINTEAATRSKQLEHLRQHADRGIHALCLNYLPLTDTLLPRCRLPLMDMAMPALRELSLNQYRLFRDNLEQLIAADGKLELFEWCLQKILYKNLHAAFFSSTVPTPKYDRFALVEKECRLLLSLLAAVGHADPDAAERAFTTATTALGLADLELIAANAIELSALDTCLDTLLLLSREKKQQLLLACVSSALSDTQVKDSELELIRAVSITLDCPLPPVAQPY